MMKDILEITNLEGEGGSSKAPVLDPVNNPNFDFEQDESLTVDLPPEQEHWVKFEKMAADKDGAASLRHDSSLLDKIFAVLQMTPTDLKAKENRATMRACLSVLARILQLGKSDDPQLDITKNSSL